eukprot:Skav230339  [mRNA]  locus=scaffold920:239120:249147:- [translate_table: standard]
MLESRANYVYLVIPSYTSCRFLRYYTLMSMGFGLAYQNQRAYDSRPIYAVRWMGWTLAIPTLIFMLLGPILHLFTHPGATHQACCAEEALVRILPQQAATAAYCWVTGRVDYVQPRMGWFLNILGCVAYVFVIADEMVLVYYNILKTTQPILKGYSGNKQFPKECIFIIYTWIWLFGNWGYASSYACQRFYTVRCLRYISLKATMGSLLFYYWNESRESPDELKED